MPQRTGLGSVQLIGELQERAARAVPAAVEESRGACWLRYTDSMATWWAGAALMHGPTQSPELATQIAAAEHFYAEYGELARFQDCPACPPTLDDALRRRRYALESVAFLLVASTEEIMSRWLPQSLRVDLKPELDAEWLALLMAAQAHDVDPAPEWRLLQRVNDPSAYATIYLSGRRIAVGRAVADSGCVGVFNMATLPDARRQGGAGTVLAAFADWANRQGCSQMYLQVEQDNTAALKLYERAGFKKVCTYHYRGAVP